MCSVSLLTLTTISVDRLLALLLGLRYRQVVTLKKTCLTVIGFWILSIVGASTYFWNLHITRWYLYIALAFCLVTTIFAKANIFFTLHHNQIHVQNHACCSRTTEPSNSIEHRSIQKGSVQCTGVQVTLVICYLPSGIIVALQPQRGKCLSIHHALEFTITLVYLNSSLNPLLYCWKVREVRQAVKETLRQLFCRSS